MAIVREKQHGVTSSPSPRLPLARLPHPPQRKMEMLLLQKETVGKVNQHCFRAIEPCQ